MILIREKEGGEVWWLSVDVGEDNVCCSGMLREIRFSQIIRTHSLSVAPALAALSTAQPHGLDVSANRSGLSRRQRTNYVTEASVCCPFSTLVPLCKITGAMTSIMLPKPHKINHKHVRCIGFLTPPDDCRYTYMLCVDVFYDYFLFQWTMENVSTIPSPHKGSVAQITLQTIFTFFTIFNWIIGTWSIVCYVLLMTCCPTAPPLMMPSPEDTFLSRKTEKSHLHTQTHILTDRHSQMCQHTNGHHLRCMVSD